MGAAVAQMFLSHAWHASEMDDAPVTVATYDETRLPGILEVFEAEGYVTYLADGQRTHRVLTAPGVVTLVALDGRKRVVGVIQVQGDGQIQGHVSLFVVSTDWRRRGVGSRLLTAALTRSGCMRLDLLSSDEGSDAFYRSLPHRERAGFRIYRDDQETEPARSSA